jgi:hypothetical protein
VSSRRPADPSVDTWTCGHHGGVTLAGQPCRQPAIAGADRCRQHLGARAAVARGNTSLAVALRRAKALELRIAGKSPAEIVDADIGYRTAHHVVVDVGRALAATVAEPAADVRAMELLRLDQALQRLAEDEAKVRAVRDREHVTVSHGRVIYVKDDAGNDVPLIDDAPVLQANAQLMAIEDRRRHIQDRRAKYLGLDAPAKVQVISDDDLNREEQRLAAELAELEQAAAGADPADPGPAGEEI